MFYPVLEEEMKKNKVTRRALAIVLGIHLTTVVRKLKNGYFSIEEAEKIHRCFFPNIPMAELFKKGADGNASSKGHYYAKAGQP